MNTEASEGVALSAFAEAAADADDLAQRLTRALAGAEQVRAEISEAIEKMMRAKTALRQARSDLARAAALRDGSLSRAAEATSGIERAERRLKEIQKMLDFGVQDAEIFAEMGQELSNKKRRNEERDASRRKTDAASALVVSLEASLSELRREAESCATSVKELQKGLPDPHLFAYLGLAHFGRAAAHLLLTADASIFDRHFREGAVVVRQMHREMREGRYRIDRFGDLLAGRHEASVQAIYGAAAIGDLQLASEIFSLAADPGMYFHHIFNVFRTWLMGAYLLGDRKVLGQLLRVHRFARGVWRGYVLGFRSLVEGRASDLNTAIGIVLEMETRPKDLEHLPGLGLVHLPALGLARLGRLRNLRVTVKDERLPEALVRW